MALGQQSVTITGMVTDEEGNPLPGANVVIEGTPLGAAADGDGAFRFVVPAEMTLGQEVTIIARFIGFTSQSATVKLLPGTITQDFLLNVDVLELESVVVTGMGMTQVKAKLGMSIASVKPEEIVQSDEADIVSALAGKAPNVEIVQTSGDPGSSSYIRIRGGGSIDRGTQPLFVVDGVPIDNSRLSGDLATNSGIESANRAADINPEDIESIEILKGSAAAALYGSRASNGVVLISTKSGKPGRTRISYKFQYGTTELSNAIPLQQWYGQGYRGSSSTTSRYTWGPQLNVPSAPWYDPSQPTDEVWDHATDVSDGGNLNEHNVTVSGGNERTTFFLSMGRFFEKGHWEAGSDYTRTNVRLKGSQVITDKFRLTGNLAYTNSEQNMIQRGDNAAGIGIGALRTPPNFNNRPWLHTTTGFHRSYTKQKPDQSERVVPTFDNPFWVMYEHVNRSDVDRIQGYIKADYDLSDWVNLSYTIGSDRSTDDWLTVMPPGSKRGDGGGRLRSSTFNIHELNANLLATIQGSKFLGRWDWLDATLMFGHTLNRREYNRIWVEGQDFGVTRGFNQLDNTVVSNLDPNEYEYQRNIESLFGQATIDLYDQLYLTGGFRNDGSSTFGEDKRHWYPKMSAAWSFTNFAGMPDIPFLNFGKLRFAYGVAGVQPGVYAILSAFTTGSEGFGRYTDASLTPSYNGKSGFRSSTNIGNVLISPERTREFEYGLDLAFWDSRIGLELTYYDQLTTDVIFDVNVAPSRGFFSQEANAATITNKGWELALNFTPIRKRNFRWDAGLIWATNDNLVTDMSGATWEGLGGNAYAYAEVVKDEEGNVVETIGHPLGEYRMQSWLRFGHGMTWDLDGDGVRDNIDELYAGQWKKNDVYVGEDGWPIEYDQEVWSGFSPNPDWTGSIRNEFTLFRDFTVSAFIDIVDDRMWNNYGKGQLVSYGTHEDTKIRGEEHSLNIWFAHGEKAVGPGATNGMAIPVEHTQNLFRNQIAYGGDRWRYVENAGYVKLREISVAYNLKHSFLRRNGISDVTIRLSGRNLKTWTDYTGWDPDTNRSQNGNSRGIDYFNSPQVKAYNVTLRVNY
jgi:TonB-linked SusC/RagA family outer membrane protein